MIFPLATYDAFIRDSFTIDGLRIDAAEFFEPVPFYAGDNSIMKLYRFSVYNGDEVVTRYYLEESKFTASPFYVSGKSEARDGPTRRFTCTAPGYRATGWSRRTWCRI